MIDYQKESIDFKFLFKKLSTEKKLFFILTSISFLCFFFFFFISPDLYKGELTFIFKKQDKYGVFDSRYKSVRATMVSREIINRISEKNLNESQIKKSLIRKLSDKFLKKNLELDKRIKINTFVDLAIPSNTNVFEVSYYHVNPVTTQKILLDYFDELNRIIKERGISPIQEFLQIVDLSIKDRPFSPHFLRWFLGFILWGGLVITLILSLVVYSKDHDKQ